MNATPARRVAIYSRVSTASQNTENQVRELRQVAERHGWQVVSEFSDGGISGAKGRDLDKNSDILYDSNDKPLAVLRNRVGGNVQVFQNTGGVAIRRNRIDGRSPVQGERSSADRR